MKAESRCRGQIDILGVIDRNAEYLADLARGDRIVLRLVEPVLPLWRLPRTAQIDDAADGALEINDGSITGLGGA